MTYTSTHATPTGADDPSAAQQVADTAQHGKQAATEVAHTAAGAAQDVATETRHQADDLIARTRDELTEQTRVQQGALVETLRLLGDQLAALTDNAGRAGDGADDAGGANGTAVDLVGQARDRSRQAADWLDGRDPADVLEHLRDLGRRQPGRFLLAAAVAGVLAGRLTRNVAAVHTDSTDTDSADTHSADTHSADTGGTPGTETYPTAAPTAAPTITAAPIASPTAAR